MVKIFENNVNRAVFVDTSNRYVSGRPIGDSANCVKTLWGLVAPLKTERALSFCFLTRALTLTLYLNFYYFLDQRSARVFKFLVDGSGDGFYNVHVISLMKDHSVYYL